VNSQAATSFIPADQHGSALREHLIICQRDGVTVETLENATKTMTLQEIFTQLTNNKDARGISRCHTHVSTSFFINPRFEIMNHMAIQAAAKLCEERRKVRDDQRSEARVRIGWATWKAPSQPLVPSGNGCGYQPVLSGPALRHGSARLCQPAPKGRR
jgi:hypothetical protein